MGDLILIDTCLRLLSAGALLLIALVVALGNAPAPIRFATVGLKLSVAAYLANVAPVIDLPQSPIWPPVQLASQSAPLFLWIFAHRLFERCMNRRVLIVAAAITLVCWGMFVEGHWVSRRMPMGADIVMHLVALALTVHALVIAWAEHGDDLLEKRRVFRTGFVWVVGIQTVGVVLAEAYFGYDSQLIELMLLQSGTSFLSVLLFGAVLLSSNSELLFDPEAAPVRPPLSPAEHVLKQKLDAAMADGGHRETGLTIGKLADRLGTPEHRLRALINQRMGYRNFSAFLNSHRIAEARAWLGDPAKVDLPVLTIAMDLGYASLAPFNRAFRDATGQTPTDYRRAAILTLENS
jgi:AraC-like DNA-binding protein